jgi:hypothetical protein
VDFGIVANFVFVFVVGEDRRQPGEVIVPGGTRQLCFDWTRSALGLDPFDELRGRLLEGWEFYFDAVIR